MEIPNRPGDTTWSAAFPQKPDRRQLPNVRAIAAIFQRNGGKDARLVLIYDPVEATRLNALPFLVRTPPHLCIRATVYQPMLRLNFGH
jgi:hypothetical protein